MRTRTVREIVHTPPGSNVTPPIVQAAGKKARTGRGVTTSQGTVVSAVGLGLKQAADGTVGTTVGPVTAIGTKTVTHYVEWVDKDGQTIKLAVVT